MPGSGLVNVKEGELVVGGRDVHPPTESQVFTSVGGMVDGEAEGGVTDGAEDKDGVCVGTSCVQSSDMTKVSTLLSSVVAITCRLKISIPV